MVYLSSWEEFSRAAEQLYSEHPSKVGFHRMRLPVICSDGFMALVSRTWCVKRRVVTYLSIVPRSSRWQFRCSYKVAAVML